jgi:ubiquinone biosynthesis protein COQ9
LNRQAEKGQESAALSLPAGAVSRLAWTGDSHYNPGLQTGTIMAKSTKKQSKTADKTPDEMRDAILDGALAHVPFDGWCDKALARGAADAGVSEAFARLAFPAGTSDMVDYYLRRLDARMVAQLGKMKLDKMRIRDRITAIIELRLRLNAEHREVVRRTVTWAALPGHVEQGARALWRTADAMWRAAGDTATDYNHYTKRAILSGVYSATLLVWLQDESEDYAETSAFLKRRIDNVMQFEKVKAKLRQRTGDLPNIARILGKLRYPDARR